MALHATVVCGGILLMVCSLGNANMAAFARFQDIGSASQTLTEEVCHEKLAATGRDIREVDEENFLDEEDMDIYGLKSMTDPLDLVCCNTCKKPIKASQYSLHTERCKSIYSRIIPETNVPALKKKPQQKASNKLINHANQAISRRDLKKDKTIDNGKINASASSAKGQIQRFLQAEGNPKPNGPHLMNDKRVSSYNMECSGNATLHPSKPFKRAAAGSPTNLVNECVYVTEPKVFPHVPKPMATKIYYSQSNHDIRRAICHMFYDEPSKDYGKNASQVELERVNALPIQNLSPGTPHDEHVMNQQGGNNIVHRAKNHDRVLAPSSEFGGYVSLINLASQIPMNNNIGPHYR